MKKINVSRIKMLGVEKTVTDTLYELASLGNSTIYLSTPDIRNLSTTSYFANPLVTLVVTYLGK